MPGQGISPNWSGDNYWSNIYIASNHIFRCGKGLIAKGCNWLVEFNNIERIVCHPENPEDADYTRFFGSNIVFRYKLLHGTKKEEIGSNSHTDGFQTYNTTNALEFAVNILFEFNYIGGFFHQGLIARRITPESIKKLIFRNNIVDSPASWCILLEVDGITVKNNIFFNGEINGVGYRNGLRVLLKTTLL